MDYQTAETLLLNEKLVALPTDTVYGIAALASSKKALNELYELKRRPKSNPMTLNLSCKEELEPFLLSKNKAIETLTSSFWPGALTLVVPVKKELVHPAIRAGLDECGFRVAGLKPLRDLIERVGPIALPSANLSGQPPLLTHQEIQKQFPELFVVKEEKKGCMIPSTVVRVTDKVEILREGAVSAAEIQDCLSEHS